MKLFYSITSALVVFYFHFIQEYLFLTSLGIGLTVYFSHSFIYKLGRYYPIREFMILLALFQWVIGAKLAYNFGKTHYKYYMYVDESTYMEYVVPAIIFLILGLYSIKVPLSLDRIREHIDRIDIKQHKRNAQLITLIGLLSPFVNSLLKIGGLGFVFYLGSLFTFVGASYYIFIYPNRRWLILFVTVGFVFYQAILQGMFHSLLLTGAFMIFVAFNKSDTIFKKLTFILVGVFASYFIQIVKHDYRSLIWKGENTSYLSTFSDLLIEEITMNSQSSNSSLSSSSDINSEQAGVNVRLNQGWIISKVLDNVPKRKEFLGGNTILQALEASFLPRALFPDKAGAADGLKTFEEVTGLKLGENTSMGLSIVAELYANYGIIGGWMALFLYGFILAFIMKWLITKVSNDSSLIILWFVFFFFQVIKAETDLIKTVNHLSKSIFLFLFLRMLLKVLNFQLFPIKSTNTVAYEKNNSI